MRKFNFLATTFEEAPNVVFLYPFPQQYEVPFKFEIMSPFSEELIVVKLRGSSSRIYELNFYEEVKDESLSH